MGFKEQMQADIRNVFLNVTEFADIHTVGGVEMPVLIDNHERMEREARSGQNVDGVYTDSLLIYVAAETLKHLPSRGAKLEFDGRQYTVTDAVDEDGLYVITLAATRTIGRGYRR